MEPMVSRSFFFGPRLAILRSHLLPHLQASCSTFELLTAFFWRCRTLALQPQTNPHHQMRMICVVTSRDKFQPPIPAGFYGNTFAFATAIAPAGELCRNPLSYAVEQVSRAKNEVTPEYMQSVADLMAISGRSHFRVARSCLVTDLRHINFGGVDFGWGQAAYSGPADVGTVQGISSFYIPLRRKKKKSGGEDEGILAPFCLPGPAMDRFVAEIERMIACYEELGPTPVESKL